MKHPDFFTGRLGNRMFQIAYLYARVKMGIIPDWYLQNPKYFEGFEDEIQELFGDGIGYLEQVGVHVRRNSNPINPSEPKYSDNSFYVNLAEDTEYYQKALALFPSENFLIFSDDNEFADGFIGSIIPKERFQVMERTDDVDDLNLMASCRGLVGANSSYSWWAGFLNQHPGARIVFPSVQNWYRDGIERTVCPQEWTRI